MSAHAQATQPQRRPPAPRRQLQVVGCELVFSFTGRDGRPGHLYRVGALAPDGRRIEQDLRAFEELPVGLLREYEVTPYQKPGKPISYTLKLPRPTIAELAQDLRAARREIAQQTETLELHTRGLQQHSKQLLALEQRLALIEAGGPIELGDETEQVRDEDEIPF